MKRFVLAILILASGTTVFCAFHRATTGLQRDAAARQTSWQTQTQLVAQLQIEREQWLERVHQTKVQLGAQPPASASQQRMEEILNLKDDRLRNLSAEQTERLLAELGFNWNTSGEYLIVSKKTLGGVSFTGMEAGKLTEAARATLAIAPGEQMAIEAMTQRLQADHATWAKLHVQREEPTGDVLAKYTLPVDAEFSQSLSNAFASGIYATLGGERGELFRQHAHSWMEALGMFNGGTGAYANQPTTLTVKRYRAESDQLGFTLQQAGGMMSTSVSPWQGFPEAFVPFFPGVLADLAARERFELPKEFNQQNP